MVVLAGYKALAIRGERNGQNWRGVSADCSDEPSPVDLPKANSAVIARRHNLVAITCSVSDASGNQNSCSFNVTVSDTHPPVFPNGCLAPVNVAAASACPIRTSAVVSYVTPTATDCAGVSVTCSPPTGSTFPLGTTSVSCTAIDTSSNTAQCSFTVTVFSFCLQDETNPGTSYRLMPLPATTSSSATAVLLPTAGAP